MNPTPDTASRIHGPQTCGVYRITNKVNGKSYVGSAKTFAIRWHRHKVDLRKGSHCNEHLQRAWARYGEGAFDFMVVCLCPLEDLVVREDHFIQHFQAAIPSKGYNIRPRADDRTVLSPETRIKLRFARLGVKASEETRRRQSAALKGHIHSEGTKAKIGATSRGRVPSVETRAKISAGNKGKTATEETKAKMRRSATGRVPSEETKAKLRERNLGKKATPEALAKMSASQTGRKMSNETRAKIAAAHIGMTLSAETRAKISAARRNITGTKYSKGCAP